MSSSMIRTFALGVLVLSGACDAPNDPTPRSAIVVVSGDEQRTLPGAYLPRPLVVRAVDENGEPIEGLRLTWSGSAEAIFEQRAGLPFLTNADGIAARLWWPGYDEDGGSYTATVSAEGLHAATFTAVSAPGALEIYPVPDTVRMAVGDTASVWMRVRSPDGVLDTIFNPGKSGMNWGPGFPRVADWGFGAYGRNVLEAVEPGVNSTYHFAWGKSAPVPGVYFTVIVTPR